MTIDQAVILAGGLGSRLGELTRETPKPMLPVAGRPFVDYLLWNLKRHGIRRVVFSIGYLAEQFIDHFGDGSALGLEIETIVEQTPLGTAGCLRLGREKLAKRFLMLNGDTILDVNYLGLAALQRDNAALAALALRRVPDPDRYGSVTLDGPWITDFAEKRASGENRSPGLINGGVYVMDREVVDLLPEGASSLERDLFPRLAAERNLAGMACGGYFIDIGVQETLQEARETVLGWQRKPAVFFDRDGVLNVDHGYVHKPDDFDWTPGALEAIRWCNDRGWLVFVVTNQAGIGRGYYDKAAFHHLTDWMRAELREIGAHIDEVFFCPHHPTAALGKYLTACHCRKPAPGMLEQAAAGWPIDKARSLLFGDKTSDLGAAGAFGIEGILVEPERNILELVREHCEAIKTR